MAGSRTEILGRIRLALAKPSLEHHHGHQREITDQKELFASAYSCHSVLEKFKTEFKRVGSEVAVCQSPEMVIDTIKDLILLSSFQRVVISRHEICCRLRILEQLQSEMPQVEFLTEAIESENPFQRLRLKGLLATVPFSITGAEYLIADIGTIVASAGTQASRQISLLPMVHLVLATVDQIYPNMAELFRHVHEKHGENLPGSALTLITGPSRTADIEKVLIKGVHGPTRLLAIILET